MFIRLFDIANHRYHFTFIFKSMMLFVIKNYVITYWIPGFCILVDVTQQKHKSQLKHDLILSTEQGCVP